MPPGKSDAGGVPDTLLHPATTESLLLSLQRPIALVGNGCFAAEFGGVIDGFASVLRLNNYLLPGFERRVGAKTSVRISSGWKDIEPRDGPIVCSPFRADASESSNLASFRAVSPVPVLHAVVDVHPLVPDFPRPSTGLAIAALASYLGIELTCFGFDGFSTGHYWDPPGPMATVHSSTELEAFARLPGITMYPVSREGAHARRALVAQSERVAGIDGALIDLVAGPLRGERILLLGDADESLLRALIANGSTITSRAVESLLPQPEHATLQGGKQAPPPEPSREDWDRVVAIHSLEHLPEDDISTILEEAFRVAPSITIVLSTTASAKLASASGEGSATRRPVRWWIEKVGRWFGAHPRVGAHVGQLIIDGERLRATDRTIGALPPQRPSDDELGLAVGYRSRTQPSYFEDTFEAGANLTWQPDVYRIAAELARLFGRKTVIDVGCGHARKLVALHPEFRLIGIDYGINIDHCRRAYPFGEWLESDLEAVELLPIPVGVRRDAVVVCADVIEHLVDPRPLLATMRELLQHAAVAVLTTPDRARTYGALHYGPPSNPAHVREWTLDELAALCKASGLDVLNATYTRSNDASPAMATSLLVLRGTAEVDAARDRAGPAGARGHAHATIP